MSEANDVKPKNPLRTRTSRILYTPQHDLVDDEPTPLVVRAAAWNGRITSMIMIVIYFLLLRYIASVMPGMPRIWSASPPVAIPVMNGTVLEVPAQVNQSVSVNLTLESAIVHNETGNSTGNEQASVNFHPPSINTVSGS